MPYLSQHKRAAHGGTMSKTAQQSTKEQGHHQSAMRNHNRLAIFKKKCHALALS